MANSSFDSRFPENMQVIFTCTSFEELCAPNGFLQHDPACYALWYYYVNVSEAVDRLLSKDAILYEDQNVETNFFELFKSVAIMYGVMPERMIQFWRNVDMTARMKGYPVIDGRWKFDKKVEIKTQ